MAITLTPEDKISVPNEETPRPGVVEGVTPVTVEVPSTRESQEQVRVAEKYQDILSKVTPTQGTSPHISSDDDIMLDAKHIGALTDETNKIEKLISLAKTKGVVHAVKVARSLKDYYALDRMHDELSGKLYDGLVSQGLISKE